MLMRASGEVTGAGGRPDRGRVLEVDRPRVCRELGRAQGVQSVAETDGVDVLLVDGDGRVGVEAPLHPVDVTDGGDAVGRGVDPTLQDQGVADAADGTGGDDPLVLDHHRLGARGPQRVDDRLHVLLVHDDVVRGEAVRQGVGGALGVVERDLERGATDLGRRGGRGQLVGGAGQAREVVVSRGVRPC